MRQASLQDDRQARLIESIHGGYVHRKRVSILGDLCSRFIPPSSKVLDVGCGDGHLARVITGKRADISIQGIDVSLRENAAIAVEKFDGKSIPYAPGSFDVVMLVDVLHHTSEPMLLLHEAVRVARQAVLIKDHLLEGTLANSTLRFMDWIGNARHGVALPNNYWTFAEWHEAFREIGLSVDRWESNLKLYPFPANLIFGRSLHFIALLGIPAVQHNSNATG